MEFKATLAKVTNQGSPPRAFLEELVTWARMAPEQIFSPEYTGNRNPDIFDELAEECPAIAGATNLVRRRALMCEVLRVLGGFESSWGWMEGEDLTAPRGRHPSEIEAGIFQCSSNSMDFDRSLVDLFVSHGGGGKNDHSGFGRITKADHVFAIEYCARLLRFTTQHHGPIKRGEVYGEMSVEAVAEFERLLQGGAVEDPPNGSPEPEPLKNRIRIFLDPGHGGSDSGAVGTIDGRPITEKFVVLDVSEILFAILIEDPRFEVFASRRTDEFVSLGDRARMANELDAVLLSIHANASNGQGKGFEVWTYLGESVSDKIADKLFAEYRLTFPGMAARVDYTDGDVDKEASFAVLRQTDGPAVLFELGFIYNAADVELLADPDERERMARALYRGLLNFYALEEVGDEPVPDISPADPAPDIPVAPGWEPKEEEVPLIAEWVKRRLLAET